MAMQSGRWTSRPAVAPHIGGRRASPCLVLHFGAQAGADAASCAFERMKDPVLFPFGAGLEYTEFSFTWSDGNPQKRQQLHIPSTEFANLSLEHKVNVANIGNRASPVVVLAFIVATPHSPENTPAKKLYDFKRVPIVGPGANVTVNFAVGADSFSVIDSTGASVLIAGHYIVEIGSVDKPAVREIELRGATAVLNETTWAAEFAVY
eukprot:SAG31_NODE_11779_length_999_cov_1.267778_2_plen_207_part_00